MIKLFEFKVLGDDRGCLVSLEENSNIPFIIKRVYYIFDTKKGVSRGYHAHRDLEQVVVCVKGSCRITLDNGIKREDVVLDSPNVGLYIDNNKWREMHDFSEDCVLLVLASNLYDEQDYVRDYNVFLNEVAVNGNRV